MRAAIAKAAALMGVAALGPLTGPLVLGLIVSLRGGRRVRAALFAAAIAGVWLGLPALLAGELGWLAAHRVRP